MMKNMLSLMSEHDFAALGGQDLAYITELPREEALELAEDLGVDIGQSKLYALHAGDGTRVAVTDDHGEAIVNAWEFGLTPVTLH